MALKAPSTFILNVGSELLRGLIPNTNGLYLSRSLTMLGFSVEGVEIVGDDEKALYRALEWMRSNMGLGIVTGGLGLTSDDITRKVVSRVFKRPLVLDHRVLDELKRTYKEENASDLERLALFPLRAEPIPNPCGMAWGFAIREEKGLYLFLPGVPKEMMEIFETHVIEILKETFELPPFFHKTLRIFGLTEVEVEKGIRPLLEERCIRWGIRVDFPEVLLDLVMEKEDGAFLKALRERLHPYLFSEGETIEEVVGRRLREKGLTLFLAESCTGGLIGHRITSVPGSSDYFKGGIVAYHNEIKERGLGVPYRLLRSFGAVSKEVAAEMARGAREYGKTDIGLSVTGIAGPGGGSKEKPVGTVFIGLSDPEETIIKGFRFHGDRDEIKVLSSRWALEVLRRHLEGIE